MKYCNWWSQCANGVVQWWWAVTCGWQTMCTCLWRGCICGECLSVWLSVPVLTGNVWYNRRQGDRDECRRYDDHSGDHRECLSVWLSVPLLTGNVWYDRRQGDRDECRRYDDRSGDHTWGPWDHLPWLVQRTILPHRQRSRYHTHCHGWHHTMYDHIFRLTLWGIVAIKHFNWTMQLFDRC